MGGGEGERGREGSKRSKRQRIVHGVALYYLLTDNYHWITQYCSEVGGKGRERR